MSSSNNRARSPRADELQNDPAFMNQTTSATGNGAGLAEGLDLHKAAIVFAGTTMQLTPHGAPVTSSGVVVPLVRRATR